MDRTREIKKILKFHKIYSISLVDACTENFYDSAQLVTVKWFNENYIRKGTKIKNIKVSSFCEPNNREDYDLIPPKYHVNITNGKSISLNTMDLTELKKIKDENKRTN